VSPSLLDRVASVLLALFGLAHQLGFRQVDPRWGGDSALGTLKATQFEVQGMTRTYWDFFSGFGLFVTIRCSSRPSLRSSSAVSPKRPCRVSAVSGGRKTTHASIGDGIQ